MCLFSHSSGIGSSVGENASGSQNSGTSIISIDGGGVLPNFNFFIIPSGFIVENQLFHWPSYLKLNPPFMDFTSAHRATISPLLVVAENTTSSTPKFSSQSAVALLTQSYSPTIQLATQLLISQSVLCILIHISPIIFQ